MSRKKNIPSEPAAPPAPAAADGAAAPPAAGTPSPSAPTVAHEPTAAAPPQSATAIKPTVGRIVLYVLQDDRDKRSLKDRTRPAIITRVWSDGCVQLSVFTEVNDREFYTDPLLLRSSALHAEDLTDGQWSWMPFQKGQAQKVESVSVLAIARADELVKSIEALKARLAAIEGQDAHARIQLLEQHAPRAAAPPISHL